MGLMYNSQCVLTHPQWPWGSPQCITVNTELHSVVARGFLLCKSSHNQEDYLHIYHIYAHQIEQATDSAPILCASLPLCTHTWTQHAPLHPHKTVAVAQINIYASPCMSPAVTGTLWYERDPIDPRPIGARPQKAIIPLPLIRSVCERERTRWRGVWGNEV